MINNILEQYSHVLGKCSLFNNIPENGFGEAIEFLHGYTRSFKKGEYIIHMGDDFSEAGIILSGAVEASYTNNKFDKLNDNHFFPSDMFGEILALKKISYSPVTIQAIADTDILFLDVNYILTSKERCCSSCAFNHQLMLNLLDEMINDTIFSNLKLRILSQNTLRDRILVYFRSIIPDSQNIRKIPFTQTALAEFLNVNRSALSRELGRMQDEGIIIYNHRSVFINNI